jgi:hypothetical protein
MPRPWISAAAALALACAASNALAEDASPIVVEKPASPPLMVVSGVMLSLAAPATVAGAVLTLHRSAECDTPGRETAEDPATHPIAPCTPASGLSGAQTAGVALLAAGGGLFAVGIPLWMFASRPTKHEVARAKPPVLAVGPSSVRLSFAF